MATVIDSALAERCDALARAIALRDSGTAGAAVVELELGAAVARIGHVLVVVETSGEDANPALVERARALLADAKGDEPDAPGTTTGRRSRRSAQSSA